MNTTILSQEEEILLSPEFPENWKKGGLIGKGQIGCLFFVEDIDRPQDKKFVVREIMHPQNDEKSKKNIRELEILRLLKHKRIVPFYGSVRRPDVVYIFSGYMRMGSLADYIAREKGMNEDKIRLFTRQILEGVNYLHSKTPSIVHRNIKGSNVLLEDENNIRLSDFGLSKILHNNTNARSISGTYKWMAPEVILADGQASYDLKADIWSIGCTVVEMATQKPPFPDLTEIQTILQLYNRVYPIYILPEKSSDALKKFLGRTFVQDPETRPQSIELLEDPFLTECTLSDLPTCWSKGRMVGTGSQGKVYLIKDYDNPDKESIVVKEITTNVIPMDLLVQLFKDETDLLTNIKHEKLVTFYGLCASGNTLRLFMKYMKMGSLEDHIVKNGPLDEHLAKKFTKDILEGVEHLHAKQLIHRDISGKHVFLDSKSGVKLGGFGVSKILRDDWNVKCLLNQESNFITPESIKFMAPEMKIAIEEKWGNSYDEKVDIWSIGCTVVQMLTGKPPSMNEMDTEQLSEDRLPIYNPPGSFSEAMKNFLMKTFFFDPNKRPSATELLDDYLFTRSS